MQKKSIAIISDSFAGLILTAQLERDGHSVTLIDTDDCLKTQKLHVEHNLHFYPANHEFKLAIESLNSLLISPIDLTTEDLPPLTFEDGIFKPFVGFGDSKSTAIQPLSRINSSQNYQLSGSLEKKLAELSAHLSAKIYTYSEISQIDFSASRINKLIINGSQEIIADHYIFLNSPREIIGFIPEENLGSRTRSRIMKSPRWARVALELFHEKPLFDGKNLLFLIPNQNDQDPCVGQFLPSQSENAQVPFLSIWETYIYSELSEDAESVANVIKGMRKLIKKAFPELDPKTKEIITVSPHSTADLSWLIEQKEIAKIADNLIMYPCLATPFLGVSQCVVSAYSAHSLINAAILLEPMPHLSPSLLASDASC